MKGRVAFSNKLVCLIIFLRRRFANVANVANVDNDTDIIDFHVKYDACGLPPLMRRDFCLLFNNFYEFCKIVENFSSQFDPIYHHFSFGHSRIGHPV